MGILKDDLARLGNANPKAKPGLARAAREHVHPSQSWYDLCLGLANTELGTPHLGGTALDAWHRAGSKHQHGWYNPPEGVPVFWGGGAGHVALSDGKGNVWSNDILRRGDVDLVPISEIHAKWGKPYLGWTDTLNGESVYTKPTRKTPAPPPAPVPAPKPVIHPGNRTTTPMTSTQFLAQLAKWKVAYKVENAHWATFNRNAIKPDGPKYGLVFHHTGDPNQDGSELPILTQGRPGIPGPLCNWAMDAKGVAQLIGWGRANHAGIGSSRTLAEVRSENYSGNITPGPDDTDGNSHFYGQETEYSGAAPPTKAAYDATVRIFAAVCDWHGWTAKACIGHKEWTGRKDDPGHVDMKSFRADVQALLDKGPA